MAPQRFVLEALQDDEAILWLPVPAGLAYDAAWNSELPSTCLEVGCWSMSCIVTRVAHEVAPGASDRRSSGWQLVDGRWFSGAGATCARDAAALSGAEHVASPYDATCEGVAAAVSRAVPVASSNAEAVGVASDAAVAVPAGVPGQRAAVNVGATPSYDGAIAICGEHTAAISDAANGACLGAGAATPQHSVAAIGVYDNRLPDAKPIPAWKSRSHFEFLPGLLAAYKTVFSPRRASSDKQAMMPRDLLYIAPIAVISAEHTAVNTAVEPRTAVSGASEDAAIDAAASCDVSPALPHAKKKNKQRRRKAAAAVPTCPRDAANAAVEGIEPRPAAFAVLPREVKRAAVAAELAVTKVLARLNADEARIAVLTKRIRADKRIVEEEEAGLFSAKREFEFLMQDGRARGHIP
jgi:hypothetical protein